MAELAGSTHALFDMIWNRHFEPIDESAKYLVKFHDGSGRCTFTKEGVIGMDVLDLMNLANAWGEHCRYYKQ